MPSFRFYLITDDAHAPRSAAALLPGLVAAGLRAVQVRERALSPDALAIHCRTLIEALGERRSDLCLFLNHEAALAQALGFDGVHLRENSVPLAEQPKTLRASLRWGVSTHSVAGVRAAAVAGADFATFGPVFVTPSKAAYGEPVGLAALEQAAASTSLPLYALGGVTPERVRACLDAGAFGVAAISAIWDADDPPAALQEFRDALGEL